MLDLKAVHVRIPRKGCEHWKRRIDVTVRSRISELDVVRTGSDDCNFSIDDKELTGLPGSSGGRLRHELDFLQTSQRSAGSAEIYQVFQPFAGEA